MSTTLYFVRHAQPDFRVKNESRPLSAEGARDARVVLEALRGAALDAAWCSPYPRSLETIRETAEYFGLPIRTDDRLREREAGPGGNTRELMRRRWADHDFHEAGGESLNGVAARNLAALRDILTVHAGQRVLIGTHGTALSTILHHFNPDFGFDDFWRIIDWMPYVLRADFEGQRLLALTELAHVGKPFKG